VNLLDYADGKFRVGLERTDDGRLCGAGQLTRENFRQLGLLFHDYLVKQGYPLVAKMRAEAALCTNVAAAVLVSAAAYLSRLDWRLWPDGFQASRAGATTHPLTVMVMMLIAFAASVWASYYRHGQRIRRYFSLLDVLKFGQ
jgi:lipopolysaccharide export LptBFGC system permease protein LptF